MPIYIFKCLECKKLFEDFKHVSERDMPAKCMCGSENSKRQLFVGDHTIVVKGAGHCGVSIAGAPRNKKKLQPGEVNMDDTLY